MDLEIIGCYMCNEWKGKNMFRTKKGTYYKSCSECRMIAAENRKKDTGDDFTRYCRRCKRKKDITCFTRIDGKNTKDYLTCNECSMYSKNSKEIRQRKDKMEESENIGKIKCNECNEWKGYNMFRKRNGVDYYKSCSECRIKIVEYREYKKSVSDGFTGYCSKCRKTKDIACFERVVNGYFKSGWSTCNDCSIKNKTRRKEKNSEIICLEEENEMLKDDNIDLTGRGQRLMMDSYDIDEICTILYADTYIKCEDILDCDSKCKECSKVDDKNSDDIDILFEELIYDVDIG